MAVPVESRAVDDQRLLGGEEMKKLILAVLALVMLLPCNAGAETFIMKTEKGTGHGFHLENGEFSQGPDGFGNSFARIDIDNKTKSLHINFSGVEYESCYFAQNSGGQLSFIAILPLATWIFSIYPHEAKGFITMHRRSNVGKPNSVTVPCDVKIIYD